MKRRALCGLAMALAASAALAGGEPRAEPIAVVVSAAWATPEEIPLAALRRLYLGRSTRWAGRDIERYDLAPGSAARRAFAASVIGRSESELEDYWLEQALRGGAVPPLEVESVDEMRRTIAGGEGRIGYLPLALLQAEDARRLRVLAVRGAADALHPRDAGYPIQMQSAPDAEAGAAAP